MNENRMTMSSAGSSDSALTSNASSQSSSSCHKADLTVTSLPSHENLSETKMSENGDLPALQHSLAISATHGDQSDRDRPENDIEIVVEGSDEESSDVGEPRGENDLIVKLMICEMMICGMMIC